MGEAFVATGGQMRQVTEALVAVDGVWRSADEVFVADGGQHRRGYTQGPDLGLSAVNQLAAPYSRIDWSLDADGFWDSLQVVATMQGSPGTRVVLHAAEPAPPPGTTLSLNGTSPMLVPRAIYDVAAEWTYGDLSGTTEIITVSMPAPPTALNIRVKRTPTDVAGGMEWDSSPDVDNWNSHRLKPSYAQWFHGGDKPYIDYASGLSPSTEYRFKTQARVNGQWGPWSDEFGFTTEAPSYTPGEFNIPVSYVNCYQSGGSQGAKWQDSTRSTWYGSDGAAWGSTRGRQRTAFWYDKSNATLVQMRNAMKNGGSLTHCWIWVHRANTSHGYSSGVQQLISLHRTSYPNAFLNHNGDGINYVTAHGLKRGESGWLPVPPEWARAIINDTGHYYRGLALGDYSDAKYYSAYQKGGSLGVMRVRIV